MSRNGSNDPLSGARLDIDRACAIEDHGDAFYLVIEHDGIDLTLALSLDVAKTLSAYLAKRLAIPRA